MFLSYLKIVCEYTTFLSVKQAFKVRSINFDYAKSIYRFSNSFYTFGRHHTVEMNTLHTLSN